MNSVSNPDFCDGLMVASAFQIAEAAHKGQTRKGSEKPYLSHTVNVASYVADLEGSTDIHVAAALLHDVTEDCDTKFSMMITDQLPRDVWDLVCQLTDPGIWKDWANRATRQKWYRERLTRCTSWSQTIKVEGRLDNVSTMEDFDEGFRELYAAETVLLVDALEDSPRNDPIKSLIMNEIGDYL